MRPNAGFLMPVCSRKQKDWRRSMKRKAFTLVELLVVIAISAILLSMVVRGMSTLRKRAESVQCQANLREVGVAFFAFVQDNKGECPRAATSNSANPGDPLQHGWNYEGGFWFNALGPYLSEGRRFRQDLVIPGPHPQNIPFVCPSVKVHGWCHAGTKGAGIDFGLNNHLLPMGRVTAPRRKLFSIPDPAQTLLMADSIGPQWSLSPRADRLDFRHNNKANVLYFDGHVGQVSREECADSAFIDKLFGRDIP